MGSNNSITVGMKFGTPKNYLSQMRSDVKNGKGSIHYTPHNDFYYYIPKGQEVATKHLMYTQAYNRPGYRNSSQYCDDKGFSRWDSGDYPIKDNLSFNRMSAPDGTYAIDINRNGIVDKGEIFDKNGKKL